MLKNSIQLKAKQRVSLQADRAPIIHQKRLSSTFNLKQDDLLSNSQIGKYLKISQIKNVDLCQNTCNTSNSPFKSPYEKQKIIKTELENGFKTIRTLRKGSTARLTKILPKNTPRNINLLDPELIKQVQKSKSQIGPDIKKSMKEANILSQICSVNISTMSLVKSTELENHCILENLFNQVETNPQHLRNLQQSQLVWLLNLLLIKNNTSSLQIDQSRPDCIKKIKLQAIEMFYSINHPGVTIVYQLIQCLLTIIDSRLQILQYCDIQDQT